MAKPSGGLPVGRFVLGCALVLGAAWGLNKAFGRGPALERSGTIAAGRTPAPLPTIRPATPKPEPKPKPAAKKPKPKKKWTRKPKPPGKKAPKRTTVVKGPAAWTGPGFGFAIPAHWTLRPLPPIGKAPREIRRWELSRPLQGGRAKIDVEADRSENYARKGALLDTRAVAAATAETFGFRDYRNQELTVKAAPGFYESWIAQVPGGAPFRVVAAHFLRGGVHYRVGAVAPVGDDAPLAEAALRGLLGSWRWK